MNSEQPEVRGEDRGQKAAGSSQRIIYHFAFFIFSFLLSIIIRLNLKCVMRNEG